jgi:hypothetical protein
MSALDIALYAIAGFIVAKLAVILTGVFQP